MKVLSLRWAVLLLLSLTRFVHSSSSSGDGNQRLNKAIKYLHKGHYKKSETILRTFVDDLHLLLQMDLRTSLERIIQEYHQVELSWVGLTIVAEILAKIGDKDQARLLAYEALKTNENYADSYILLAELVDHDVDLYQLYLKVEPYLLPAISYGSDNPNV
jgi:hypothetical protein